MGSKARAEISELHGASQPPKTGPATAHDFGSSGLSVLPFPLRGQAPTRESHFISKAEQGLPTAVASLRSVHVLDY